MVFQTVLYAHIGFGSLGLLMGPIAMLARKKKGIHTQAGAIYHWVMLAVCVSAAFMAILHWSTSWYLFFIAAFSYRLAFKGYRAAKLKYEGWLPDHISGMLGSYIALVTALLVVNASRIPGVQHLPYLSVWFIPTIIGTPLTRLVQSSFGKRTNRQPLGQASCALSETRA